jgi:hypothetical protein
MTTCVELAAQLVALEAARLDFELGRKTRVIGSGRSKHIERETYDPTANARGIARVKRQLDACNGTHTGRRVLTVIPIDANSHTPWFRR